MLKSRIVRVLKHFPALKPAYQCAPFSFWTWTKTNLPFLHWCPSLPTQIYLFLTDFHPYRHKFTLSWLIPIPYDTNLPFLTNVHPYPHKFTCSWLMFISTDTNLPFLDWYPSLPTQFYLFLTDVHPYRHKFTFSWLKPIPTNTILPFLDWCPSLLTQIYHFLTDAHPLPTQIYLFLTDAHPYRHKFTFSWLMSIPTNTNLPFLDWCPFLPT